MKKNSWKKVAGWAAFNVQFKAKSLTGRYLRRLAKEVTLVTPIFLTIIFVFNFQLAKSSFDILKENVQINPMDHNSRLLLAQYFIESNQFFLAERELNKISASNQELFTKITALKNEPLKIRSEILRWQRLTTLYPYHRDGHIKLAILNWRLYRTFDSQKNLKQALKIDPNNLALKKIEDSLK